MVTCQFCGGQAPTSISYENGTLTWLSAATCVLFGCVAGCCLIPFCTPSLQDLVHSCGRCGALVGVTKRL